MTGSSNSTKSSRLTPSPTVPTYHGSKLPKFLQKQGRDRSKSMNDQSQQPSGSANSSISSSSSSSIVPVSDTSVPKKSESRKSSKLKGVKELREEKPTDSTADDIADESMDEPPVIIEPINIPSRPRTRSERPLSASSSDSPVSYYPSSSGQRFSDLPTRLSGWLSHTFSSSSTDLSLPSLLSQSQLSTSPKSKASGLLTAAKHGKGHLDKAMRYLLDSDATPDKCTDPIWILGVQHTGYEPPPPPQSPSSSGSGRRSSSDFKRPGSSLRSSTSSRTAMPGNLSDSSLSQSQSAKHPGVHWPPVFYADFTSRVWLTYRSNFLPIRDQSLSALDVDPAGSAEPRAHSPIANTTPKKWNWPVGGEKGWTSDSGWGCMLRTGQSLLANALIHLHLGRDWRRPPQPVPTADYATYVKILTWFLDSPDPLCPFGVHRMALAGKELGKDVGQWFGPSTAAGAIKTLVGAFPEAGLGVSVATDGVLYETDVIAASYTYPYRHSRIGSPRRSSASSNWGQRAVLVLVGIRLGIDGVNPIYYDSVKALYSFPQSVGIAGGRPSSSYYFVGVQGDSLFYLDPHHARPAIPLRTPPRPHRPEADSPPSSFRDVRDRYSNSENSADRERDQQKRQQHTRMPTPPSASHSHSHSQHSAHTPSPLQKQISSSQSSYMSATSTSASSMNESASGFSSIGVVGGGDLDPVQEHYVTAYPATELKTFHCDRVRKMPLSGLDPSMLIGFLCRDERDWKDLRARVSDLSSRYKTIVTIQDEPPFWPSDSDDIGLESVSDVDIDIDEPSDEFSESPEPGSTNGRSAKRQSEDVETEEDPLDPLTPGAGSGPRGSLAFLNVDDEDAEWVDPALPTPTAPGRGKHGKSQLQMQMGAPGVRDHTPAQQEYYPFPVVDDREEEDELAAAATTPAAPAQGAPRQRTSTSYARDRFEGGGGGQGQGQGARSRPTRARDGGRTQSGGVRGIVAPDTDDGDDF